MTTHNSGIFSQSANRESMERLYTGLSSSELKEEFKSAIQQILVQSSDRVVLRAQMIYRELRAREIPATFNTESLEPLPFEGASTLLTYAASCVRDWELLHKGGITQAPDELDSLGSWLFTNDTALKNLARE